MTISKQIFLIDNYDSFTYNLVNEFRNLGHKVIIYRNTISPKFILEQMEKSQNEPLLVLGPGSGSPENAGNLLEILKLIVGKYPIIGISLGYLAICKHYGATITIPPRETYATSKISHFGHSVFSDIPSPLNVGIYHSPIAINIPKNLDIIAKFNDISMGVINRQDRVIGFQFNPESIMTSYGNQILAKAINFVSKPVIELKSLINKLYDGIDLTVNESIDLFEAIFAGDMNQLQLSSVLTALKIKGETADEISGASQAMLHAASPFELKRNFEVGEIVGTGGDNQGSINISTISAIVAASCGLHIAKHGNRSVSSKTGTSDVLNALGVNITMTPQKAFTCLKSTGLTFLFAPKYHLAMRFALPVRGALGVKTIFNILGPLTNPSKPDYILLGVYSKDLISVMVNVLKNDGVKRAFVVYGSGLDEIAIHNKTDYAYLKDNEITYGTLTAADFGFENYPIESIKGGLPDENKEIAINILKGLGSDAQNAVVSVNTGALLYLGGIVSNLKDGAKLALETIKSGKGYKKLLDFIDLSTEEF